MQLQWTLRVFFIHLLCCFLSYVSCTNVGVVYSSDSPGTSDTLNAAFAVPTPGTGLHGFTQPSKVDDLDSTWNMLEGGYWFRDGQFHEQLSASLHPQAGVSGGERLVKRITKYAREDDDDLDSDEWSTIQILTPFIVGFSLILLFALSIFVWYNRKSNKWRTVWSIPRFSIPNPFSRPNRIHPVKRGSLWSIDHYEGVEPYVVEGGHNQQPSSSHLVSPEITSKAIGSSSTSVFSASIHRILHGISSVPWKPKPIPVTSRVSRNGFRVDDLDELPHHPMRASELDDRYTAHTTQAWTSRHSTSNVDPILTSDPQPIAEEGHVEGEPGFDDRDDDENQENESLLQRSTPRSRSLKSVILISRIPGKDFSLRTKSTSTNATKRTVNVVPPTPTTSSSPASDLRNGPSLPYPPSLILEERVEPLDSAHNANAWLPWSQVSPSSSSSISPPLRNSPPHASSQHVPSPPPLSHSHRSTDSLRRSHAVVHKPATRQRTSSVAVDYPSLLNPWDSSTAHRRLSSADSVLLAPTTPIDTAAYSRTATPATSPREWLTTENSYFAIQNVPSAQPTTHVSDVAHLPLFPEKGYMPTLRSQSTDSVSVARGENNDWGRNPAMQKPSGTAPLNRRDRRQ